MSTTAVIDRPVISRGTESCSRALGRPAGQRALGCLRATLPTVESRSLAHRIELAIELDDDRAIAELFEELMLAFPRHRLAWTWKAALALMAG